MLALAAVSLYVVAVVRPAVFRHRMQAEALLVPASLARVELQDQVGTLQSARDFAFHDGVLYVLDWRASAIVLLRREVSGEWSEIRRVGRRGHGPGEFWGPAALGSLPDGVVVVLERSGRLHAFNPQGDFLVSRRLHIPCASARPQVLPVDALNMLVATQCRGRSEMGLSPDTTFLILWWVNADDTATRLVAEAAFTTDGRWGSGYPSPWPLSVAGDSIYFGGGVNGCLYVGLAAGPSSHLVRKCDLAPGRYSTPRPDDFGKPAFAGRAWEWPDPLPSFVTTFRVDGHMVFVRPSSFDSVVFQVVDPQVVDPSDRARWFMVAPLDSFRGCKAEGCLWYDADSNGGRIAFLPADRIRTMLVAARARGLP